MINPTDYTGRTLGHYVLRELLGVGGMGSVYRAYDKSLEREVAVKVISGPMAAQADYIARFTKEAKTAAGLEHPNIVPVYAYNVQGNISYVVMRLLTGGSLTQRIRHTQATSKHLPTLHEAAELVAQIGSALDYAHGRGVVHRDVKPQNIMFDQQGKAYLVDFGIAKLAGSMTQFTMSGTVLGSPSYMSPEQWRGEELTGASDQYALAVSVYQMLSGRLPFEADSQQALMYKHLSVPPTPLDTLVEGVPQAVIEVLDRALAKRPQERYASCREFARAFTAAVATAPTSESTGFFTFQVVEASQMGVMTGMVSQSASIVSRTLRNRRSMVGSGIAGIAILAILGVLIASRLATGTAPDSGAEGPTAAGSPNVIATEDETQRAGLLLADVTVTMSATNTATDTSTPTATSTPTDTATPTSTPTATDTPTLTPTDTATHTPTVTDTPSSTPTPTMSAREAALATRDAMSTISAELTQIKAEDLTATATLATATPTASLTLTPSLTATDTATHTLTFTPTATDTPAPTDTAVASPTDTPTATDTPAPTSTPTDFFAVPVHEAPQIRVMKAPLTVQVMPFYTPAEGIVDATVQVNLRVSPGSREVVTQLQPNAKIFILETQGEWTQARTINGDVGWMSTEFVLIRERAAVDDFTVPESIITRAFQPITRNGDWQPVIARFDDSSTANGKDSEMVLVPVGCFYTGQSGESALRYVCFDRPFWIDRYDGATGGVSTQRTNCTRRGARLPTETEWEYAARGPESWIYPWGNEFIGTQNYVLWSGSGESSGSSTPGRTDGVSWVGAEDMSGNYAEWVEVNLGGSTILRGGSVSSGALDVRASARARGEAGTEGFGRCIRPVYLPSDFEIPSFTVDIAAPTIIPTATFTATFTPSNTPTPTHTPTITLTPRPCFVITPNDDVPIYVGPNSERPVRQFMPIDTMVPVYGKNSSFWLIRPDNAEPREYNRYWVPMGRVQTEGDCDFVLTVPASD